MKTTARNEFRQLIKLWLLPLGFTEIYSINHPTETTDEVHFIKNGIRVICIFRIKLNYSFWYVYADCYATDQILSIRNGKNSFENCNVLEYDYINIKNAKAKLEKN